MIGLFSRYRRVHGGRDSFIEHRHSMSILDSSQSDHSDTSGRAASISISSTPKSQEGSKLSPELRRNTEETPGAGGDIGSRNAANHMSCPDLETMVARAGGVANCANLSGGIPNRALEILDKSFGGMLAYYLLSFPTFFYNALRFYKF